MRAVVWHGKEKVSVDEVDDPEKFQKKQDGYVKVVLEP